MTPQELQERIDMKPISENVRKLGYENKVLWKDGSDVIETWTESKRIDVRALHREKEDIERLLTPLTDEQYIELGKVSSHPQGIEERLADINKALEQYG